MTAGFNVKADVWRINYAADDEVGGAVITGTVLYPGVDCRIQADMPQQLLLQQGLETPRMYTVTVRNANLDIRERDEIQIVFPPEHKYLDKRFRVVGVTESNFHPRDRRGYLLLNVIREERSHANVQ